MFGLPQSIVIKKQLPKKAIYAKFDLKPSQCESFDADISRMDIVAVISPSTIPALAQGQDVKEIYVVAVTMKCRNYNKKNIELLTKLIPQKMVLALHYEDEVQFAIYHTKLITSEWKIPNTNASLLTIEGLHLDAVWEGLVKTIGNITVEEGNTLKAQISEDEEKTKILKQIELLEKKCRAEKQPRKKYELHQRIVELKKRINKWTN